jgi:hypothetical protein
MKSPLRNVLSRLHLTKPEEPRDKKRRSGTASPRVAPKTKLESPSGPATKARATAASARTGSTKRPPAAAPAGKSGQSRATGAPPGAARRVEANPGPVSIAGQPTPTRTGETVFGDLALRFRSLTLNAADLAMLEQPSQAHDGFKIRIAGRSGGRRHAGTLVDERYAGRGYTTTPLERDPRLSTFIAYDEGVLVGTVSVRLDSAKGLSADELYRQDIDALRRDGAKLCEFTRLAVDRTVASKPVLAGLFHTAYLYAAVVRGCTHAVIEVNPRHVAFYRRVLAFERMGEERMNLRVHAPAVLLCVPFAKIAEGLAHAGERPPAGSGRSLFAHGFPPAEASGVLGRLQALAQRR